MNAEEILRQTFAEHEALAPDAEATLAGIHDRLPNRRRIATVLAAAAVVALIVAGFSVLAAQQRRTTAPPPASTPTATVPAPAGPTDVSVSSDWLPPGTVRTTMIQRYYGRQINSYSVTGSDGVPIAVELRVTPGSDLTPTNGGDGPPELGFRPNDLIIGGRPAREWRNDSGHEDSLYTVVMRLPGNRVAQVAISVPPSVEGRGAALADIGRRVAAALRLDRAEPIDPAYRPAYVPRGFVIQSVGRDDLNGTSWILATPRAVPDGAAVTIIQDATFRSGVVPGTVAAGRTVQGRPTHVITDGATATLWIDLLRPGVSVRVTSEHAAVPLAELYRIADGLRFPG